MSESFEGGCCEVEEIELRSTSPASANSAMWIFSMFAVFIDAGSRSSSRNFLTAVHGSFQEWH